MLTTLRGSAGGNKNECLQLKVMSAWSSTQRLGEHFYQGYVLCAAVTPAWSEEAIGIKTHSETEV